MFEDCQDPRRRPLALVVESNLGAKPLPSINRPLPPQQYSNTDETPTHPTAP